MAGCGADVRDGSPHSEEEVRLVGGGFGQVKGVVVQRRRARDFRVHQDWGLKNLWAQPQRVDIYAKTVPNRANVHTLLVPGLVVVYGSFGAEAFWSLSLPLI